MITYRKNINKFQRGQIPDLIKTAQDFLRTIYKDPKFDNVDYIFSSSYRRSRYFRNEINNGKYINPTVCIANRTFLMLYDKKSLVLKKFIVNVGGQVQMVCALIHELTHHIQYNEKRSRGELETTRNELEYLKLYYPQYYRDLIIQEQN